MIRTSVRIERKNHNIYNRSYHNILSDKSFSRKEKNNIFEINGKGQIRERLFERKGRKHFYLKNEMVDKFLKYEEKSKEDYEKHNKKKLRNDSRLFLEGVITFGDKTDINSHNKINEITKNKEFDNLIIENLQKFFKKMGIEKNDFVLYKHNDEEATHYHFHFCPYDFENHKPIGKKLNKMVMSELQTIISKGLEKHNIFRGEKKVDKIEKYLKERDLKYEDLTPSQMKEMYDTLNLNNQELKKYYQSINKNIKILEKENQELKNEREITKEDLKNLKTEIVETQKERDLIKQENQELRKDRGRNLEQIKEQERIVKGLNEKIKTQKQLLKNITENTLTKEIVDDIMKKHSKGWIFKSFDYEKITSHINKIVKNKTEKQFKEIIEENNYYKNENDTKKGVIKRLEEKNNDNINELKNEREITKTLKKENQELKNEREITKKENQEMKKMISYIGKKYNIDLEKEKMEIEREITKNNHNYGYKM